MNDQKFKVMPTGGSGIDWRGCGFYALTLEQAKKRAVEWLNNQNRGRVLRASSMVISHRKPGTEGKGSVWREVVRVLPDGTVKECGLCYNPLTEAARLSLVKSVSRSVFDNFESFREQNVGADLAYLLMAIAEDTWQTVDWTKEGYGDRCELLEALDELYPDERHAVWLYIQRD